MFVFLEFKLFGQPKAFHLSNFHTWYSWEMNLISMFFLPPFSNIPSFFCLYCSISCSVLYNLGVLCGCIRAVSGKAMAQPPTLLLLIEMDWGKASLSSLSLMTHTSVVNTHATLVWVLFFCSYFVLLLSLQVFFHIFLNIVHTFPLMPCSLLSHHSPL